MLSRVKLRRVIFLYHRIVSVPVAFVSSFLAHHRNLGFGFLAAPLLGLITGLALTSLLAMLGFCGEALPPTSPSPNVPGMVTKSISFC